MMQLGFRLVALLGTPREFSKHRELTLQEAASGIDFFAMIHAYCLTLDPGIALAAAN